MKNAFRTCEETLYRCFPSMISEKFKDGFQTKKIKISYMHTKRNGEPDFISGANAYRYHFPDIDLNPLRKIQLMKLIQPNCTVTVTFDEDYRIHKLDYFSFYWATSSEEENPINQLSNRIKDLSFQPQETSQKITLSIISLSRGLLYVNVVLVTTLENLRQFFSKKTNDTAKITFMKSEIGRLPDQIFILVEQDYLTFSIPDLI